MTPRLLVVAATAAEAAYVPAGVPVVVTGIGKVAAAAVTAATLAEVDRAGLTVCNLGTAGALRPGVTGLRLPSQVVNHDISAALLASLGYPVTDTLTVPDGDGSVLATGDTFLADPVARDRLAQRADLVDMEGFAVAFAAIRAGVPVRLVKHVSDAADERALDWPARVDASARVLGAWVAGWLEASG